MPETADPGLLRRFGVSRPRFVTRTALASLWQVDCPDGRPAALKHYRQGMDDEAPGIDLLEAWAGQSAVEVYARSEEAVLLEWLEGPSLGQLLRSGKRAEADARLAATAKDLHRAAAKPPASLRPLAEHCAALFTLKIAPACPTDARRNFARCRARVRELLGAPRQSIALHGDLHHDNLLLAGRGCTAIDPKGLFGEAAYDLANAFRNPQGADALLLDGDLQRRRASTWSSSLGIERARLLAWAAVQAALSIAWDSNGAVADHPELPLLSLLTALAEEANGAASAPP